MLNVSYTFQTLREYRYYALVLFCFVFGFFFVEKGSCRFNNRTLFIDMFKGIIKLKNAYIHAQIN